MRATGLVILLAATSLLVAQDPPKPKFVPAPFECFNINGKAKGRPHCLVCKFGLAPSVLIFTKEPAEGKDGPLNDLLEQLDKLAALPDYEERDLSIGVVFLSPDAKDSTNNAAEEKSEELLKEAITPTQYGSPAWTDDSKSFWLCAGIRWERHFKPLSEERRIPS